MCITSGSTEYTIIVVHSNLTRLQLAVSYVLHVIICLMKRGFLQALGVALYCSLVGLLFWQGENIFPKFNPYFGPVMMLLLLSTSVLICGMIVFYKPYLLFFEGKKKEAVHLVLVTAGWLFIFLLLTFLLMITI